LCTGALTPVDRDVAYPLTKKNRSWSWSCTLWSWSCRSGVVLWNTVLSRSSS